MAEDIRLWKLSPSSKLCEIRKSRLDLEERLEHWIENDISLISYDLIIIGRQVETDFGGVVDLLCLDSSGNVVIIELKRDKTPRDITAQLLDYASWVKELSNDHVSDMANRYLKDISIEEAFEKKFGYELPEIINENHEMLIVASEIDSSTERIVNYLSDSYGVAINAISFQYFKDENAEEYIARGFLIEQSEVERKSLTKRSSKRKPPLSVEEFKEIAQKNGIGELFECVLNEFGDLFDSQGTTRSSVAWSGLMGKSMNTIFCILPNESSAEEGLRFYVYIKRLSEYLRADREDLLGFLPSNVQEHEKWGSEYIALFGYFQGKDDISKFEGGNTGEKNENVIFQELIQVLFCGLCRHE